MIVLSRRLYLPIITLCILLFVSIRRYSSGYTRQTIQHGGAAELQEISHRKGPNHVGPEKLAYATYLSSTIKRTPPDNNDRFFVTARMLGWQLLHAPETRTQRSIPFLVLVDPGVSQSKRDRLQKDGAIVVPIEWVRPKSNWLKPAKVRYADLMTKLRLWELEEYDRILFIDSDTMLQRPLDGLFDHPSTQVQHKKKNSQHTKPDDEAPVPSQYVMAGVLEVPSKHKYPPAQEDFLSLHNFNGGFFVCSPSKKLFNHYMSILAIPGRFDPGLMEQALLNYAHRDGGPMPFKRIPSTWNIRNPNDADIKGGVASVHEKWWKGEEFHKSRRLREWFVSLRWRMEGFYEAQDAAADPGKGGA